MKYEDYKDLKPFYYINIQHFFKVSKKSPKILIYSRRTTELLKPYINIWKLSKIPNFFAFGTIYSYNN